MTSTSLVAQVALRAATTADLGDISRIMNNPPEPPMTGALGPARAGRLGDFLVRAGITISLPHTTVAILGESVVAVMDAGSQYAVRVTLRQVPGLLSHALAIVGPTNLARMLYAMYIRQRVQFDRVPDAYPIAELYVDERYRNRGIGGRLLEHAEDLARRDSYPNMCIETGATNPALRFYERHGYRLVATELDARYERLTGVPGAC